jgi:hypothetical protein
MRTVPRCRAWRKVPVGRAGKAKEDLAEQEVENLYVAS